MEAIERKIIDGVVVESVNLIRATMLEAQEIKTNLMEDIIDSNRIIVDLRTCEYIDSTFLGALVYSNRKIKEQNGFLILLLDDSYLARTFLFNEIGKIFRVHNSLNAAIDEIKLSDEKKVVVSNDKNFAE